jgi:hypothetical protein
LACAALAIPASSSTIEPLGVQEILQRSDMAFEGTVVSLETLSRGVNVARDQQPKVNEAPAVEASGGSAGASPAQPGGLGVEGGRMLFTRVTLAVDRELFGAVPDSVVFDIAGGSEGDRQVIVHGMPEFELGKRYVVFLRPDYRDVADPIVGVNQGYFEVVEAAGQEALMNINGDLVLGIAADAFVVRRGPDGGTRPGPSLAAAPTPEPDSGVVSDTSPEVLRYWTSEEPGMTVDMFASQIIATREGGR